MEGPGWHPQAKIRERQEVGVWLLRLVEGPQKRCPANPGKAHLETLS